MLASAELLVRALSIGRKGANGPKYLLVAEDEMVGWHHQLNGHEFEQTPGDGEGQQAWCAAALGVAKSQTQLSD